MSNKKNDRREAKHRLSQKFDNTVFASLEAQAAADQAVTDGLTVEGAFRPGEELFGIEPIGNPEEKDGLRRWRVADIRAALAAREARKAREAEEEVAAPIAEEIGAPEAEVPEIIEVTPTPEPEVEERAPEIVEEQPAPTWGERIRGFFSGIKLPQVRLPKIKMPEVRLPTWAPIAGVALLALILFAIFAVSVVHPRGLIRQRLAAPGQRIAALEEAKAKLELALIEETTAYSAERDQLEKQVEELEGNLDVVTREKVMFEEAHEGMIKYQDQLAVLARNLKEEVATLEEAKDLETEVLKASLDSSYAEYEELAKKRDQFSNRVQELHTRVAELEGEKTDLEGQITGLVEQVSGLKTEKSAAETRIAALGAENAALGEQVAKVAAERDQLATALAETTKVTVKEGDTVWDLTIQKLGFAPTWGQIVAFAETNGLTWKVNDRGTEDTADDLLVVYIQPGEIYNLATTMPVG